MQRVGFVLKVKEDLLDEYKRRHEQVWPEMLAALREAGWHIIAFYAGRRRPVWLLGDPRF